MRTSMRFILVLLVLGVGVHIGTNAIKSVDQIQEQRMEVYARLTLTCANPQTDHTCPERGIFMVIIRA